MPKMSVDFTELQDFNRKLTILAKDAEKVLKFSLFDGAGIAADELRKSVDGLARVPDVVAINAWRRGTPGLISVSQKNGLRNGLGISHMRIKGKTISVKAGFDGYNDVMTRRWPKGQPNIMIAASCEHGSSAMLEQPFIRPTFYRCRARIVLQMEETAQKKIQEIILDE